MNEDKRNPQALLGQKIMAVALIMTARLIFRCI